MTGWTFPTQDGENMIRKILHTSDWHIGRKLKEHDRTREFQKFFDELLRIIHDENIDALLVAGDIFDNTTPTVQAQDMYYSLLSRLVSSPCRHIVIISGNHDSPSFLDAPADLLEHCRIHVVGQARQDPAEEVLPLSDSEGRTELIVCAVPFLRNRDVMRADISDSFSDIESAIKSGIVEHYRRVFERARELQGDSDVPVIAMGHLFLQEGRARPDDGTRELYVGTAIRVDAGIFPEWLTYTALGHLHSPQTAGRDNIRYSGSPIQMGFGEAGQNKAVYILDLEGRHLTGIREAQIPEYQRLERISGDIPSIISQLGELGGRNEAMWVEVTHTGTEATGSLHKELSDYAKAFPELEILSVNSDTPESEIIPSPDTGGRNLDDISPEKIFDLLMDSKKTPESQRELFRRMYQEILHSIETGEAYQ